MSEKNEPKKQKYFLDAWLSDPLFTGWLCKDKELTKARCSVCHKTIELSSSGRSALTDHAKGKKHKESNEKRKSFFKPKTNTADKSTTQETVGKETTNDKPIGPKQQTIDQHVIDIQTVNAEIIWILKGVMSGYSIRSNDDLYETFSAMFPELKSLKNFNLARTKSMYVINHGLSPHFKSLLDDSLKKSDIYIFSFDESLNDATQTSEMDMYIRYWDDTDNRVHTRYYGSSFLGHGTHQDILTHFSELTKELDDSRLFQVSMDGPNVNLKFFREFSSQFKETNNHSLVNIGSCCLHVINGSFARGVEKSEWGLKKLLKGAYHLLHNTPARREDYESLTGSSTYPLSFCSTR
jgi:hypothetical protein